MRRVTPRSLLGRAAAAARRAYAPYSRYSVGAALVTAQGRVFTGANVENVSYGLTICAERAAVFSAIASGARRFRALAIVAAGRREPYPCGACRQVLAEFGDCVVLCADSRRPARVHLYQLAELLPAAFKL